MKPALLIIDMQKACYTLNPDAEKSLNDAVEYINAAIALFRKKDLPVVCIQHMSEEHELLPGSEGFGLPDGLQVLPTDHHVHKEYGNSFNKTSLADDLRELGVDTVIVTGYCAEYCVLSTYRGARDRDFAPIVLRGALASDDPENIGFVEKISDIVTIGALAKLLD